MDFVTLGETLASFTAEEPGRLAAVPSFRRRLGGAESNTAIGLARLGCRVAWISRVGGDPFGDDIVRTLRGEGVDTRAVVRVATAPTGLMVKELRTPEETHVHYYRDSSAARGLCEDDVDETLVASAERVHVTGITLMLGSGPRAAVHKLLALARANDIPVSFDPNLRQKLGLPQDALGHWRDVLPSVTDLLLSEAEACLLTGADDVDAMLGDLEARGFESVVIKRGAAGAVGCLAGKRVEVPASAGAVIDTVGAGDAFNAGFLFERFRGAALSEALATGAWAAGKVVASHGDWEGLPDRADHDRRWGEAVAR